MAKRPPLRETALTVASFALALGIMVVCDAFDDRDYRRGVEDGRATAPQMGRYAPSLDSLWLQTDRLADAVELLESQCGLRLVREERRTQ